MLNPADREPSNRFFVNRRPFSITRPALTGAELAALIGVPADNAVVEAEADGSLSQIGLSDAVTLRPDMSFLVTRQFIMGGWSRVRQ